MEENPQGARHTNERIELKRILLRMCDIMTKQSHERESPKWVRY